MKDLAAQIRFVGKAGEAAKVKALVNMVMNINTAGLAEGLGDLDKSGIAELTFKDRRKAGPESH